MDWQSLCQTPPTHPHTHTHTHTHTHSCSNTAITGLRMCGGCEGCCVGLSNPHVIPIMLLYGLHALARLHIISCQPRRSHCRLHTHTHTHTHIPWGPIPVIPSNVCVCVCVYMTGHALFFLVNNQGPRHNWRFHLVKNSGQISFNFTILIRSA